ALETVQLAADAKSIEIETHLDPNVRQVQRDSGRLQQVIWNLLSNAVKFTPPGGRIEVQLKKVNDCAHITISDTGKGIRSDFLPYIFDYFRQENSSSTRNAGGLGLGLAVVRHLVELHGGHVEAESLGLNQGATFTVCLPLSQASVEPREDSSQTLETVDLSGINVLIVDDNPDTLELGAMILEMAGATVIQATAARDALEGLVNSQPDVLVSDIAMPEMDGYELIAQVREVNQEIPAIALTAYAGEYNEQQALKAGFNGHLAKPIEPDTLVALVASVIGRKA
ncbi:MAG: hybrid sensor histidine kinase/response regulator, partial [Cyanobacteriota bacterium]